MATWFVTGTPSGAALLRAVAEVLDDLGSNSSNSSEHLLGPVHFTTGELRPTDELSLAQQSYQQNRIPAPEPIATQKGPRPWQPSC
jgi:hypothetical protein